MRICLYWNHTAGGGLTLDRLTSVIQRAGHSVVRAIDDESDLPEHLGDAECVVVAGGDGTVARAGRVLAGGPVPMAILPLGTANNIARSLEVRGDIEQLAARWRDGQVVKVDVGVVEIHGSAHRFIESVGCGLVTSCITEGNATLAKDHPQTHLAEARELYVKALGDLVPRHYDITLDGERVSREFLLVEALNTPSIGPMLEFTADVSAADGFLSVVLLGESDRDALVGVPVGAGLKCRRTGGIQIMAREDNRDRRRRSAARRRSRDGDGRVAGLDWHPRAIPRDSRVIKSSTDFTDGHGLHVARGARPAAGLSSQRSTAEMSPPDSADSFPRYFAGDAARSAAASNDPRQPAVNPWNPRNPWMKIRATNGRCAR